MATADDPTLEIIKNNKTNALVSVIEAVAGRTLKSILVVGCGDGTEAGVLARAFGARTVGIDVAEQYEFDHAGSAPAELRVMDARELDFPDASFDLVYSFHALEHIPGPEKALAEMARVLKPGGAFLIGTPNRSRLFGYLNSATTLGNKIKWNVADYKMRLSGRWSNEAGAHAGFRERDLSEMCLAAFGNAAAVTDRYYRTLYATKSGLVDALNRTGAGQLAFPAVYVAGHRAAA